eukprot:Skav216368  [mRNA]  locus=scaffold1517:203427:204179:+ [translate_table: standard]
MSELFPSLRPQAEWEESRERAKASLCWFPSFPSLFCETWSRSEGPETTEIHQHDDPAVSAETEGQEAPPSQPDAVSIVKVNKLSSSAGENVDSVPQPPQEHLTADGHVDMTGRWKCTDVGGEMDAVFAELGFGFFGRKAVQAAGYGKGQLIRSFQHNGQHVRMTDHVNGLPDTVYEFETGKQQLVNKALQVSYWDVERPHILRWERAKETEGHPKKWMTNCAFLLSSHQLRVETTTSTHKTAWWIYDRQA